MQVQYLPPDPFKVGTYMLKKAAATLLSIVLLTTIGCKANSTPLAVTAPTPNTYQLNGTFTGSVILVTPTPTPTPVPTNTPTPTPIPTSTPTSIAGPIILQDQVSGGLVTSTTLTLPGVQAGDTIVVAVKNCLAPPATGITVTDSNGGVYKPNPFTNAVGAIDYYAAFNHAAGNTTITVSGNGSGCYLLASAAEAKSNPPLQAFAAGSGTPYGPLTTTSVSGTSSSPVTGPALVVAAGEAEATSAVVFSNLSAYGAGGGTPTAMKTASITGAQMWNAWQTVSDTQSYGMHTTLSQAGSGGGAVAILSSFTATPTPTPTATPTPLAGTTFTPFKDPDTGTLYGAGGTPLPALTNPHTYTPVAGDNTAAFQAAVNAPGDLKILKGTGTMTLNGSVQMRSNQNVQCADPTTVIYHPNTNPSAHWMLEYDGVSNASMSNCTFKGTNSTSPPVYPGCGAGNTCGSPVSGTAFEIGANSGNPHDINIVDNEFDQAYNQAAIEFVFGFNNINLSWNNFRYCGLYGPNFDTGTNGHIDHNYGFDCRIGNEPDQSSYTLAGSTVNYNYATRDKWGTGWANSVQGATPCGGYFTWISCGMKASGQGCTSTGNKAVGTSACSADNIELQIKSGAPNDGNNPTCSSAVGCMIRTN